MSKLTFEERNLVCIYSGGGREDAIAALEKMRGYLQADETELRELTDSSISKLRAMTGEEYDALDLIPDFGPEDADDAG